jgi:hypothetical protein
MSGWIKIYRDIQYHWIWDDPAYLKAWIAILMQVNHEDTKVLIQGQLMICKRGQSLLSSDNWCKILGKRWTRQKIRTFFDLLKKDSMIETENMIKTTRLTVCNYDIYQDIQPADNQQITSKEPADNQQITTNKNYKNNKNEKNNNSKLPSKSADFIDQIIDCFVSEHGNYEILNRGKERSAASKLLQQYHKKFPGANSEETLHALKTYFAACVKINDNWLRENMSLPIIISKFNQINTILRNGKLRGHSSKASDNSTVEDIVRGQGKKMGLITE